MNNELKSYTCSNCETNILSSNEIDKCVYCNNNIKESFYFENDISYDYVIPYKKTKEDIIKILKKYINIKKMVPKEFNIKKNIDNIKTLYVPLFLVDYEASGEVDFDCKKISKFKSKNKKYIKTDSYTITLGGNMKFENVPVSISKKISEDIILDFDHNNKKEFDYSYISNTLVEDPILKNKDIIKKSEDSIKTLFMEKMKKEIKDYENITPSKKSINLNNIKNESILLPIYILTINYKNQNYNIIINGENGKVFVRLPLSYIKLIFTWLFYFLIIFCLLFLLFNYRVIL